MRLDDGSFDRDRAELRETVERYERRYEGPYAWFWLSLHYAGTYLRFAGYAGGILYLAHLLRPYL